MLGLPTLCARSCTAVVFEYRDKTRSLRVVLKVIESEAIARSSDRARLGPGAALSFCPIHLLSGKVREEDEITSSVADPVATYACACISIGKYRVQERDSRLNRGHVPPYSQTRVRTHTGGGVTSRGSVQAPDSSLSAITRTTLPFSAGRPSNQKILLPPSHTKGDGVHLDRLSESCVTLLDVMGDGHDPNGNGLFLPDAPIGETLLSD